MEYIYGALLLHYAKQEINEENLAKVLQAAGLSPDEVRIKTLVAALKEVNIEEAIKSAAFAPVAAAPVTAATAPAAAASAAKAEEEKKEEEKKGPSEEEIAGSLASLF
jgi:large subunit ribosomal protein L12